MCVRACMCDIESENLTNYYEMILQWHINVCICYARAIYDIDWKANVIPVRSISDSHSACASVEWLNQAAITYISLKPLIFASSAPLNLLAVYLRLFPYFFPSLGTTLNFICRALFSHSVSFMRYCFSPVTMCALVWNYSIRFIMSSFVFIYLCVIFSSSGSCIHSFFLVPFSIPIRYPRLWWFFTLETTHKRKHTQHADFHRRRS